MRFHLHYAFQAMMLLSLSHGLIASGAKDTPATTFDRSRHLSEPLPVFNGTKALPAATAPLFAGTAPVIGITHFDNFASSALTNFLPQTPITGTAFNVGDPTLYNTPPNNGTFATGWDVTPLANNGNVSVGAANSTATGGSPDFCVRMGRQTAGNTLLSGTIKTNNASLIMLHSLQVKLTLPGGGSTNITITGVKAGSDVAGATLTVAGFVTNTFKLIDVSAIPQFNGVDGFRLDRATGLTNEIQFMSVDEISIAASTLPLTLVDFTGLRQGNDALLDWTTATEQNTSHFEVQRATDASTYTPIGKVPAAGNSTTPLHYNFIDAALPAGTTSLFYRLKSIDLDGKFTFSPILRIGAAPPTLTLSAYPNPFRQQVGISITSPAENKATITLRDLTGRILLIKDLTIQKGSNLISIPSAAQLEKGTYLLTIATGRQQQTINLVKTD